MNTIPITYLESQLTETGREKISQLSQAEQELIEMENEEENLPEGYDPKFKDLYNEMGILGNKQNSDEPYFEITFTEEDYEYIELESGVLSDEISWFHRTNGEDSTTIILKDGETIKVKENVEYLHRMLRVK